MREQGTSIREAEPEEATPLPRIKMQGGRGERGANGRNATNLVFHNEFAHFCAVSNQCLIYSLQIRSEFFVLGKFGLHLLWIDNVLARRFFVAF